VRSKNLVTRGNLDDRLATVDRWQHDHEVLATERWLAHREVHAVVEQSLRDYKRDANEWRATLADLRSTFIPKAEFVAEHRALEAKLHGEIEKLAGVVSAIDVRVDANTGDLKDSRVETTARRSVFSDTRSVLSMIAIIVGAVLSFLVLLDRLKA
jgi:hypothetical protein